MEMDEQYWADIFPHAAYFYVYNSVLGHVFAMVHNNNLHDDKLNTLSTFIIAKHGCSIHPSIDISSKSVYYPAVANLSPSLSNSKVRKALAISLLKTFAELDHNITNILYTQAHLSNETFDWDETQAGLLASQMQLLDSRTPQQIGNYIYQLGYLNKTTNSSNIVDIVYNEKNNLLSDQNNALAYLIGTQLDQLFDSLTEYSPEPTEKVYKPPIDKSTILHDSDLITLISNELITVQTNYTVSLVQFLQNFIVPLRVKVLENKIPNLSINQLNQIFPPTIDEVTRINCIFLDMLKLAQPFGSYEVLKACGETIPYFYKAQMRHEAAIKNFHSNYLHFKHLVNKDDTFDQRTIETCIYSSLNLVKIQLIIQRLVKNGNWPDNLLKNVEIYFNSCNETISSFATDKLLPYNGRIFTPTGKILTEIAKGWPSELQFGWLTRRVVSVFDATNILSTSIKNRSVIIVFSDHVLFIDIEDDQYYLDYWNDSNKIHKPSISDILIHSLTNETPLNNLPQMTVKSWSNINNLTANSYSFESNHYIRFFNDVDSNFVGIYKIDKVSSKYVTEVLARSKILNKSQSFHLFSNVNDGNKIYYTAHELATYEREDSKSPFIILFNEKYDVELLKSYNVFAFITLNFIDENTIKLESISKSSNKISYNIQINSLSTSVSNILLLYFKKYLSLSNLKLSEYLLSNNENVNSQVHNVLSTPLEKLQSDKENLIRSIKKGQSEREIVDAVANTKIVDRRKSLELLNKKVTVPNKVNKANNTNTVKLNTTTNKSLDKPIKKSVTKQSIVKDKRSSGFFNFFKSKPKQTVSKSKSTTEQKRPTTKSVKPKVINVAEHPERKSSVIIKRVSLRNKDKEIDYNTLKPAKPKSKKLSKVSRSLGVFSKDSSPVDVIIDSKSISKKEDGVANNNNYTNTDNNNNNIVHHNNSNSGDNTTMSTSIYVNSHFEFPMAAASSPTPTNPITKAPKHAPLKTEPGYAKGFKDSVDLMGKFESTPVNISNGRYEELKSEPKAEPVLNHVTGIKDSIDLIGKHKKNTSTNSLMNKLEIDIPEDTNMYDNDLFEFTTTPKTANFSINEGEKTPIVINNSTEKLTNNSNKYNKEPGNLRMSITIAGLPSCDPVSLPNSPIESNVPNPWRAMVLPTKSPIVESSSKPSPMLKNRSSLLTLQRSQSFYDRFKHLRDDQEKILKSGGISYIKDINKLPQRDHEILSHGLLFPSVQSGLNKKLTVDEDDDDLNRESNWVIQKEDSMNFADSGLEIVNPVDDLNISNIPNGKSEEIKTGRERIIVKPVAQRVISEITNHSVGSSVYFSDVELERLGSIEPLENIHNPYSVIYEEEKKEKETNTINENEKEKENEKKKEKEKEKEDENLFIPEEVYLKEEEIPMYHDDVDLLGDLELDKTNLEMSMFDNIDYDKLNEINIIPDSTDKVDDEKFNLTLGNLTVNDLTDSYFNTTRASSTYGVKRSDTIRALNSLLNDKSYIYLNDILNGVYEDDNGNIVGNINTKPLKRNVTFKDLKNRGSILKRNVSIQREPTDYDLVYYNKLMNSSISYLSDYLSKDGIF